MDNPYSSITSSEGTREVKSKIAFLAGFLPIHRIPVLERLAGKVGELRIFLSVKMEADREWPFVQGNLNVEVNHSFTLTRRFHNVNGYQDHRFVHVSPMLFFRLKHYMPDVIFTEGLGLRSFVAILYRAYARNCKVIPLAQMSEHTERTRSRRHILLRKFLLRHCDGVVAHGQSGVNYVRSLYPEFPGPFFTIPYAIDIEHFRGTKERTFESPLRLLYTGQFIERKGVVTFLEKIATWYTAHPGVRAKLQIVGSGPEKERICDVRLPDNLAVTIHPSVSFEELPTFYSNTDVYLFPTLGDEWGVVVNESLAAGVPVLGSIYGQAVEELIADGKNGWKFDPFDAASVNSALDRALLATPGSLRAMSRTAEETGQSLSPETIAERFSGAISEMLPNKLV